MTADLYELIDHAAGWRMPIRVRWANPALAEATLAEVPMLKIQSKVIEDKLSVAATHCAQIKGRWVWYISIRSLDDIAVKSDEADPERLVRWAPADPEPTVDAGFVNAYCASRIAVVKSPKDFAYVWASLQKFMLRWLVDEGRSLDLGFGRLDAFPVRANWRNAVIGRIFKNRKYQDLYAREKYEFFRRCLTQNPEMLTAYDTESRTMRWSVEFTPARNFHHATDKRENARKGNHRWKNNYLGQICAALAEPEMHERLYEAVIAYSKETDYPFAIFPDGSSQRYPPKGWQPTRSATAWYQVNLVTAAAARGHEGSAVVPEDASVPKVQDLRPPAKDVRDAGGDVAAAGENDI